VRSWGTADSFLRGVQFSAYKLYNPRHTYAAFWKWCICRILYGFGGSYAVFWTGFLGDWLGLSPICGIWVGLARRKKGWGDYFPGRLSVIIKRN
jgi:hypothetical protein